MNAALAIIKGEMRSDDTYALALYTKLPPKDKYTTTGEVRAQGYTLGGQPLESPVYGETETGAWINFTDTVVWPGATIRANGAIVYNVRTKTILKAVEFPKEISSTNDKFTVDFPSDSPLIEVIYRSR